MTTLPSHGLAPTREVLSNGAAIVVKESTTTPAVTLNVSVPAGSICDPENTVGSSYFLSRVIDRGTARRSADAIAEDLDGRGVALSVTVTRHAMTFVCTCLAEDFEAVLDLVADVVSGATCPEEEVVKRRGEIITAIRQDEDNPAVRAVEELMSVLYGTTHPYGRRTKGDVREYRTHRSERPPRLPSRALRAVRPIARRGRRCRAAGRGGRRVTRLWGLAE